LKRIALIKKQRKKRNGEADDAMANHAGQINGKTAESGIKGDINSPDSGVAELDSHDD
jgi:hypothetical protein